MNLERLKAFNKGYEEGYKNALLSVFKWNIIPSDQRYNYEFYPVLKKPDNVVGNGRLSEDVLVLTKYEEYHVAFFYEDEGNSYWITHGQTVIGKHEVEAWTNFKKLNLE
jgi:hypothetical protein